MPSSLVFAALAVAWIVVLVPMVAKRRQEVRRTTDTALAARVLRRGDAQDRLEEVPDMPEHDQEYDTDTDYDDEPYDRPAAPQEHAPTSAERRYRPGRGGFDPVAAELAARAKYAYRQRVVLALLVLAIASALLAGFAMPILWWAHGGIDTLLVGYLAYLRQQVRIEQEVRQRRADRATRGHRVRPRPEDTYEDHPEADHSDYDTPSSAPQRLPQRPVHPTAAIIDLDDEDPGLHDLDTDTAAPYRRAAGE